jgi:CRP/FNR family transcriptional regulator, anaerobic regulatory protein
LISSTSTKQSAVEQFSFLQQADEGFVNHFFNHASHVKLDAPQPICNQGDQCGHLALLLQGTARVYKLGESGREITLYRIGPGESCILTASCIISGKPFPAIAVCETPIEALVISLGEVRRWTDLYPVWRNYIFSLISDRLGDVISVVEEIAFRRVDRRLASYLLQHSITAPTGEIRITHQAIASDLGTSREVVSRILKDFEHQGLISVTRGSIHLNDRSGLADKTNESPALQ